MKHPTVSRLVPSTIAALLFLPACTRVVHHDDGYPVETYGETEVNDTVDLADYFGLLRPGDHFFIDGWISDIPYDPYDPWNGYDPFDGFAFTAATPIQVEFRLWIDAPYADLDVVVYDPQIDADVGWFETANNPETGTVQVFGGNLDFHLVVQSWIGASAYSLEIEVHHLYLATADGESEEAAGGVRAESLRDPERAAREPWVGIEYHPVRPTPDEPLELRRKEVDEGDATTIEETSRVLDTDG